MAAQKVLKKQASEEEQEAVLCPQGPQRAPGAAAAASGSGLRPLPPLAVSGGAGLGPDGRAAACFPERPPRGPSPGPSAFQPVLGGRGHGHVGLPTCAAPQLGAEAAGRACPGRPELRRPLRPVPSPPFTDFGKIPRPRALYPGCSTMHSYRPFPLGYQDASPAPGIPPQRGFRHVSCSHYHGGGLVSEPVADFQPSYYLPPPPPPPPQPQFLPPGFLSALHFLPPPPPPPPPPAFSLTLLSDTDKEKRDLDRALSGSKSSANSSPYQHHGQGAEDVCP
uniref:DMRT like family B with proline rich C-terminal 1 n=1 Tax=Sciurus vulgaris TaxID=55149 RepID=A0A8D2AMZ8_SCIVU